MPLRSGYSKQAIDANIAELRRAGHSRDSAIFVAYAEARKCWFAKHPGGHLIYELAWPKTARRRKDYDRDGRPLALESKLQTLRNPKHLTRVEAMREANGAPIESYDWIDDEGYTNQSWRVKPGKTREQQIAEDVAESLARQKGEIFGRSWEEIQRMQMKKNPRTAAPDVTRATALYRGFTGKAPKVLKKINVPPLPETALAIGKVFGIMYSVDATSERFHHEFKGTARPLLVVAADGRQVFLSGGTYTFTKRGFVDSK